MVVEFGLLTLGAYLLGAVPAAYLAAKWSRGIDLRQFGSGNVGASNLLKLTSKRFAIPVIIFDLGKGTLAIWVAQVLGLGVIQQITVGVAAIIGHNWPVFLRFSGGRGILTMLGVIIILSPWLAVIATILAFSGLPFGLIAVTTLFATAFLPISSWFFSKPLGIEEPLTVSLGFVVLLLIVITRRLTAPRTSVTESVSRGQLLINRLFLDRDIRDREAWIHRAPHEASSTKRREKQEEG